MNTAEQQHSRHVSVGDGQGVRVERTITIEKPAAEIYSFWRQLENLPRFMRHVRSVTVRDNMHSHWEVRTLAGKTVEWDAEIIDQHENEMISWRSTPGSEVDNAGSVWFTPVPGGQGTLVRVEMKYDPPAGKAGAWLAKLFGKDAETEIAQDLRRLKTIMETGKFPEEESMGNWQQRAAQLSRRAAEATDQCVHENAWSAIACVALGFFAIGYLAGQDRNTPTRWAKRLSSRAKKGLDLRRLRKC